jgi:triacylglycerol lipase
VPGLVAAKVPLLLAYAELDPPDFHSQSEQLFSALCKAGQCPASYKLMGHSHMSEVYSINSADKTVTKLIKQWLDRVR